MLELSSWQPEKETEAVLLGPGRAIPCQSSNVFCPFSAEEKEPVAFCSLGVYNRLKCDS